MPVLDIPVQNLTDNELFEKLTEFGEDPGPILATTRKLYEKKLRVLLQEDVVDSTDKDNFIYGNEDNSQEATENGYDNVAKKSESPPIARKRLANKYETETTSYSQRDNRYTFDPNIHTPSPRPSLRSVMSSTSSTTTKYITPTGNLRETTMIRHTYGSPSDPAKDKHSTLMRLAVKIVIILAIITVVYVTYRYMYSESPFKELETLARKTLDSLQESESTSHTAEKATPKVK